VLFQALPAAPGRPPSSWRFSPHRWQARPVQSGDRQGPDPLAAWGRKI